MSQQINLFNPAFRNKSGRFSAVTMAAVLGFTLLGLIGAYGYLHLKLARLEGQAARQGVRMEALRAQLAQAGAQLDSRRRSPLLEQEVRHTEAQVKARQKVLARLQGGELGDTRGFSAYLRAFAAQVVNGLWLTGFTVSGAGGEMTVTGRALQPDLVPAYINRLGREPVMRGKTFSTLEMGLPQGAGATPDKPARYIEFSIASKEAEKDK